MWAVAAAIGAVSLELVQRACSNTHRKAIAEGDVDVLRSCSTSGSWPADRTTRRCSATPGEDRAGQDHRDRDTDMPFHGQLIVAVRSVVPMPASVFWSTIRQAPAVMGKVWSTFVEGPWFGKVASPVPEVSSNRSIS